MPIRYRHNNNPTVLERLKDAGYSSTRLRKEKLLGESYMAQLRKGELVSWKALSTICELLNCQPGDILEYVAEDQPQKSTESPASPAPDTKENGSSWWADDPALPWNSEQPHDQPETPAAPKRKITSVFDLVSDEDRKRIMQESEAEHLVMPWEEPETPQTPAAKPDIDAFRRQIASMTGFDSKPKHGQTAFSNDPGNNDFG